MSTLNAQPIAGYIQLSRELAIDEGLIEPGPAERVVRDLRQARTARRIAADAARRAAWIEQARQTGGPVAGALLDLHSPDTSGCCTGCACACESYEPWPCASVLAIATVAGLDRPDR